MSVIKEGRRTAAFLVSEAEDYRSRDEVTVDATSGALEAGTILGQVTATKKFVRHDAAASDGSETEAAVLYQGIGAEEAQRTIISRAAQVHGSELTYEDGADESQITTSNDALASLGIIVR